MTGAHLSQTDTQVRVISVPILIMAESFSDLQKIKEDLAEWLIHDEPKELIFKDEQDRSYYAVVDGELELDELVRWGDGVITFICTDHFKYGAENELDFTEDTVIIENNGTATSRPIIELTAKEKSTFAMVTLGDEQFNIIGQPADDDVQIVDSRTSVLYENGSTIGDWQVATSQMIDEHFIKDIGGNMTTDGVGIRADGYGTGDALHGPAVFKEIDPIQNFQIYSVFGMNSTRPIESWRMGINFLDENLNMLGHMGIKDNSRVYKRRTPLARYGPYRGSGRENGNLIGDSRKMDNTRDLTLFHLRANRVGNVFEFFIGYWLSHRFAESWTERYIDINNEFNGRLKYITLYIATHSEEHTSELQSRGHLVCRPM